LSFWGSLRAAIGGGRLFGGKRAFVCFIFTLSCFSRRGEICSLERGGRERITFVRFQFALQGNIICFSSYSIFLKDHITLEAWLRRAGSGIEGVRGFSERRRLMLNGGSMKRCRIFQTLSIWALV